MARCRSKSRWVLEEKAQRRQEKRVRPPRLFELLALVIVLVPAPALVWVLVLASGMTLALAMVPWFPLGTTLLKVLLGLAEEFDVVTEEENETPRFQEVSGILDRVRKGRVIWFCGTGRKNLGSEGRALCVALCWKETPWIGTPLM